jgi:putative membrane protein
MYHAHTMTHHYLIQLLLHWGVMALALWVTSAVFTGIKISGTSTLLVSALLLGIANAVIRPVLVLLTLPLTILTLGLFLLVINALMIMLVAALVKGFTVSGFWTAFFASIFISLFSYIIEMFIPGGGVVFTPAHIPGAVMV